MRSKAHLNTHPIHPMLIGFPISFFMAALVFDIVFLVTENTSFLTTSYHLVIAGIIGALLAAVPGILDYLHTVPPDSSARKRAVTHGLLNTTNLVIFIVVFFLKKSASLSFIVIVGLEIAGIVLMSIAGWMGGTLVYRNQISVVPRYANGGTWEEAYFENADMAQRVARSGDLQVNQMRLLHVNGQRIVLARSEEGYVAFSDHCTHKGGSLAGGTMICGTVHCPWHGSHFSVVDGSVKAGPAKNGIELTLWKKEKERFIFTLANSKVKPMSYFHQQTPFVILTTDGKLIAKQICVAATGDTQLSMARMLAPPGRVERHQTPQFDEYILVSRGKKPDEADGDQVNPGSRTKQWHN